MLEFWNLRDTFFIGSYGISFAFWWGDDFLDVGRCLAMKSFEDDQQCFEFNPVFDWKPVKRVLRNFTSFQCSWHTCESRKNGRVKDIIHLALCIFIYWWHFEQLVIYDACWCVYQHGVTSVSGVHTIWRNWCTCAVIAQHDPGWYQAQVHNLISAVMS